MSAAEELIPEARQLSEAERAALEDPDFPTLLAKARAKANGEAYSPERHGPFAERSAPRAKPQDSVATPDNGEKFAELLERFETRGQRTNPYLRAS